MEKTSDEDMREIATARRQRLYIGVGVMCIVSGIMGLWGLPLLLDYIFQYAYGENLLILFVFVGLFLGGGVILIMVYLQTGFKQVSSPESALIQYEAELQRLSEDMETLPDLSNRLSILETLLEQINLSDHDISDFHRDELVRRLRESIEEAAKGEFLDEIRDSLKENQAHIELNREMQSQYRLTTSRLNTELSALTRRGNLNLAFGIPIAVIGILFLSYSVINMQPLNIESLNENGIALAAFTHNFVPRLSLVIVVEVFAYFFLRLYTNSLAEIKYFQNEITNVEAKFFALQVAVHGGDEKIIGDVIEQFAKTERNHILQKGQTTVNLERSRMEKETITSLIQNLLKAFSRRS